MDNGILDLFCGPGGFSLGFLQAGFNIVYSNDINKNVIATIQKNHEKIQEANGFEAIYQSNICSIENLKLTKVANHFKQTGFRIQGIIGGPPCKGFSASNRKTSSINNPYNSLFKEYFRIVEHFKPDFFVFENVPGMLYLSKGLIIKEIENKLNAKLGYLLSHKIIDAVDFGVPQYRKRFILIGFHPDILSNGDKMNYDDGNGWAFPSPQSTHKVTVGEAIFDLPPISCGNKITIMKYRRGRPSLYSQQMRKTPELRMESTCVIDHITSQNSPEIRKRYEYIPQGGNWSNIPNHLLSNYKDKSRCHSGIYKRLQENEPSVTLNNIRKSMFIHPTQNRGLSIREAARLQSFPDWYEFQGTLEAKQQMVADAVPPLMAKAIAEKITLILNN